MGWQMGSRNEMGTRSASAQRNAQCAPTSGTRGASNPRKLPAGCRCRCPLLLPAAAAAARGGSPLSRWEGRGNGWRGGGNRAGTGGHGGARWAFGRAGGGPGRSPGPPAEAGGRKATGAPASRAARARKLCVKLAPSLRKSYSKGSKPRNLSTQATILHGVPARGFRMGPSASAKAPSTTRGQQQNDGNGLILPSSGRGLGARPQAGTDDWGRVGVLQAGAGAAS